MKNNLTKVFGLLLLSGALMFFSSCGSDDDLVIDTGDGSLNLADGLYLKASGEDPSSSALLSSEIVDAEGIGATQERSGFVAGYMYLDAGAYSVVAVASKEITTTIGGTVSTVSDDTGSSCDLNEYTVVATAEGGDEFNVSMAGLYKVTHDQMTNELTLYQIEFPALIGDATPGGWSADTQLDGSVTADGGSWSATGVVLRAGNWKVRFNCRWDLNRRIDPVGSLDADNGYQFYTNLGGTATDLTAGGADIPQTEDGLYDVTMDWSPQDGWSIDLNRTGDAPTITFDPADYNFGLIGDATASGWDSDQDMFHAEENGVHTWYGVAHMAGTGEFKIRTNDNWDDFVLGGTIDGLSTSGGNIPTPGEGTYYVTLSTADEGATWTATADLGGWAIIGEGGPNANWEDDVAMNFQQIDAGVTSWTVTGDFTTGGWKFRAGADWKLNLGGADLSNLSVGGDNLALGAAGTYEVTLSFDGSTFTATAQ